MTTPEPVAPTAPPLRADDGLALHRYRWRPEGSSRAVLALAHGYAEHAGRYDAFARRLTTAGIEVWAFDQRGHGRSEGFRADYPSLERLAADHDAFVDAVHAEAAGRPLILFGHSVGGALTALVASRQPERHDLVVLASPYLRNAVEVAPLVERIGRLLAPLLPRLPAIPLDAALMSRDPEQVRRYQTDPLNYTGSARLRSAMVMSGTGDAVLPLASRLTAPILIVHGSADGVADPEGSRALYEALGSDDRHLELVPGGYHELLNDLDRDRVTERIVDWIEARLPA